MNGMTVLLAVVLVVGSTVWVAADAKGRDTDRTDRAGWVIGCLVLWIVVFPLYLAFRSRTPRRLNG